jgi:hypothetical protein
VRWRDRDRSLVLEVGRCYGALIGHALEPYLVRLLEHPSDPSQEEVPVRRRGAVYARVEVLSGHPFVPGPDGAPCGNPVNGSLQMEARDLVCTEEALRTYAEAVARERGRWRDLEARADEARALLKDLGLASSGSGSIVAVAAYSVPALIEILQAEVRRRGPSCEGGFQPDDLGLCRECDRDAAAHRSSS